MVDEIIILCVSPGKVVGSTIKCIHLSYLSYLGAVGELVGHRDILNPLELRRDGLSYFLGNVYQ